MFAPGGHNSHSSSKLVSLKMLLGSILGEKSYRYYILSHQFNYSRFDFCSDPTLLFRSPVEAYFNGTDEDGRSTCSEGSCPAGSQERDGRCHPCDGGSFSAAGGSCTPCRSGSYSSPEGAVSAPNANQEEWQKLQGLQRVMTVQQANTKAISSPAFSAQRDFPPQVGTSHVRSVLQDPLRQEKAHQLVNLVLAELLLDRAAARARSAFQEHFL